MEANIDPVEVKLIYDQNKTRHSKPLQYTPYIFHQPIRHSDNTWTIHGYDDYNQTNRDQHFPKCEAGCMIFSVIILWSNCIIILITRLKIHNKSYTTLNTMKASAEMIDNNNEQLYNDTVRKQWKIVKQTTPIFGGGKSKFPFCISTVHLCRYAS